MTSEKEMGQWNQKLKWCTLKMQAKGCEPTEHEQPLEAGKVTETFYSFDASKMNTFRATLDFKCLKSRTVQE